MVQWSNILNSFATSKIITKKYKRLRKSWTILVQCSYIAVINSYFYCSFNCNSLKHFIYTLYKVNLLKHAITYFIYF